MGLDFGTQGVRCGIFDETGNVAAIGEEGYETFYPCLGWAEQDPEHWITAMACAVEECYNKIGPEDFKKIRGVSVCSTASTVIAVDESGTPLGHAIIWMDNRAKQQAEKINETHDDILRYCGNEESVEWFIPKLLWIKEKRPDIYEKADRIVELQDYINHYLTNRWCSSISQSTCKGNYVEEKGGFSDAFFSRIGLQDYRDKINLDIIRQGEEVGKVSAQISRRFFLPENLTVYQGGIDAHTCMIGLGVCRPGDMGAVMGTSFVHLAVVDRPVFKDGIWGPYKDAIIPDLYCLEGGQVSAGSITKWFLQEFDVKGENPYKIMENAASDILIGSEGLLLLDYFQGNRTPYKDPMAKGVIYGLTLKHSKAHIYRAILEGIAFGMRNILETMQTKEVEIDVIRGCGGVTLNTLWLQIISDVTGKPILLTEQSFYAGVLGCAIISAVGARRYRSFHEAITSMVHVTGKIDPSAENFKTYDQVYKKYLELYKNLKNMMKNDEKSIQKKEETKCC
jgi:FGGY-family pentulose kinase